ncbi:hypothetical protein [Ensifer sp. B1-9]|uniref:hypothetical protein n=1 Tax=Ensifer sp. B1-9 TaxID=3141455 RepID=UPI003D256253
MDKAIIDRVNERVAESDLLFILGDFAVSNDPEYVAHVFHSLRGRKVLILGNHDLDKKGSLKAALAGLPWDVPPVHAIETKDGGQRLYMSHYAHRVWPAGHYGSFHFYGHSHGAIPNVGRSRDVGIDCPDMNFGPRRFEQLIKGMMELEGREKHLISNEIAVLMEDKSIERPALARLCRMSEAELDRLLDTDVQTVEIGTLRVVLAAIKGAE